MIPHTDVILISIGIGQVAIWWCLSFPTSGAPRAPNACTHPLCNPSAHLLPGVVSTTFLVPRTVQSQHPPSHVVFEFFRTALVLTSCLAVSYFSLQCFFTRSPQPTSRASPVPHTAHTPSSRPACSRVPHFNPRTARWSPDSSMKTRSIKGALTTEKTSSPNGAPHPTRRKCENHAPTVRPTPTILLSLNKTTGSPPSGTPSFVLFLPIARQENWKSWRPWQACAWSGECCRAS